MAEMRAIVADLGMNRTESERMLTRGVAGEQTVESAERAVGVAESGIGNGRLKLRADEQCDELSIDIRHVCENALAHPFAAA